MEESTRNDNNTSGGNGTAYTQPTGATPPPPATNQGPARRLYRTEGPLSGVCGGLADYFNVDPTLVRLGVAAGSVVTFPMVPIIYLAAWLIIPEANPAPVPPIMSPAPSAAPTGSPVPPVPVPQPTRTVDTVKTDTVDSVG